MSIRKVAVYPHPCLREECKPVVVANISSQKVQEICQDLIDTMYAKDGIGIAGPQVGISQTIFVVAWEDILAVTQESDLISCSPETVLQKGKALVLINPKLIEETADKEKDKEGCLSFPGIFINVLRGSKATFKAYSVEGTAFEISAQGLLARCLLHEFDHVTGKLLIDYVSHVRKQQILKKLDKYLPLI